MSILHYIQSTWIEFRAQSQQREVWVEYVGIFVYIPFIFYINFFYTHFDAGNGDLVFLFCVGGVVAYDFASYAALTITYVF